MKSITGKQYVYLSNDFPECKGLSFTNYTMKEQIAHEDE